MVMSAWATVTEAACFHVCPCAPTMFFLLLLQSQSRCEVHSMGCSLGRSSAREAFFTTPSWYMEAQREHSLEMRASIHTKTESKLLLYCPLSDTGAYCARSRPCRSGLVATHGEQICSLFLTTEGFKSRVSHRKYMR